MKALLLFGLAVATPVAAQTSPPPTDPDVATVKALDQCIKHASGAESGKVIRQNATDILSNGLSYRDEPPAPLAATKSTPYGKAEYAEGSVNDGVLWVIGYANGVCQIVVSGTLVPPVEAKLKATFATLTWRAERPPSADQGERKMLYSITPSRDTRLTALVSMRDDQGFTMITVNRNRN